MTIYGKILELLSQKKELFLNLEEVTSNMSILPLEELSLSTQKRGEFLEKISLVDLEIKALCNQDNEILSALNNRCDREGLPMDLANLYDASLSVKAIINRILKNEDNIRMHMVLEKQRIADKVEELTLSGTSVAEKYYQSVKTAQNHPFGSGNNKII